MAEELPAASDEDLAMLDRRLAKLKNRQPFRPFAIELRDGRRLRVEACDRIARSPGGREVVVHDPAGRFQRVELADVRRVDQN